MRAERFPLVAGATCIGLGAILVALAAALGDSSDIAGAVSGAALASANCVGLSYLCLRFVTARGPRWPFAIVLGMKFLVLMGLSCAMVIVWKVDIIWFTAGLTTAVVALVAVGTLVSLVGLEMRPR